MKQKLIYQLIHKAGARFGGDGINYDLFVPSKFAELIVEECAKRAEVYAYMSPNFNALAEELRSMIGVAQ